MVKKKKILDNEKICNKCNIKMKIIEKYQRLLDRDELGGDLSDGEEAEYIAAELGGDETGEFSITEITYECPKCHNTKIVESQ
jgi:predicted transcriptional regulator